MSVSAAPVYEYGDGGIVSFVALIASHLRDSIVRASLVKRNTLVSASNLTVAACPNWKRRL